MMLYGSRLTILWTMYGPDYSQPGIINFYGPEYDQPFLYGMEPWLWETSEKCRGFRKIT